MRASDLEGKIDTVRESILAVLDRHPDIQLCILYGSRASNRAGADSDVDLAVAGKDPLSADQRMALIEELYLAVGRDIDLVDLWMVSGVILQQILCKGEVLLNRKADLYARIIRNMWYDQADRMPYVRRILEKRRKRFIHDG